MKKQIRLLAVIGIISVLLTGAVYASLTDGLVSYFSFDTNADDDWASNDGTIYNVTHLTEGCAMGGCYYFGADSLGYVNYIELANEGNFDFDCDDAWSVGMWVNLSQMYGYGIFMKGTSYANPGYYVAVNDETRYVFYIREDTTDYIGTYAISDPAYMEVDNTWHYMVFTYNGTKLEQEMVIYKDGVVYDNYTVDDGALSSCLNNEPFRFGRGQVWAACESEELMFNYTNCTFSGEIDEAGIWSRELSLAEVEQLYNNGTGYNPLNCTTSWNCSGYGVCNESNLRPCNETVDLNECGFEYEGNYSEFEPLGCDYCAPDWSCSLYGDCNTTDLRPCIEAEDLNECGENYTGNYSEFEPEECDYCTPEWYCSNLSECLPSKTKECYNVSDTNGCYAQTGLESDAFDGEVSDYNEGCGGYTPVYAAGDVTKEIVDMFGEGGAMVLEMMGIIVTTVAVGFVVYRFRKFGKVL